MDQTPQDRPAAESLPVGHHPGSPVKVGHHAPCPRRVRTLIDGRTVLDSVGVSYVWEHPWYPQYAVPLSDLGPELGSRAEALPDPCDLEEHAVVRFNRADVWFEEDERVHGHPRSPYVRVDAVRSSRTVTVLLPGSVGRKGTVLARTTSPVAVFETGLPPRWYVDPTSVDWSLLIPSTTVTRCPYKGETTGWWGVDGLSDVAWSYGAPDRSVSALAGLVAFDDTVVEVLVDP